MKTVQLGPVGTVSRLTLGGGGLGSVWGKTTGDEAIATLYMAVEAGITLIDAAPGYRTCQKLIGEAFQGNLPENVRLTTKCWLGRPADGDYGRALRSSLEESLATMKVDSVDIFLLHNEIAPDEFTYPPRDVAQDGFATPYSDYLSRVVPAMEHLVREGLCRHWGITGVGHPRAILHALAARRKPAVVQAVANLLDSPGNLAHSHADPVPREIIRAAVDNGVGVMGIRAVQAGALTRGFDRPVPDDSPQDRDHKRAAPFLELCERWGADPAQIAHRYALSMTGVDTVVLGVKNRDELASALEAEAAGPLTPSEIDEIDGLNIRGF